MSTYTKQPARLPSEDVIISAPMSYAGSAQRILRLRRRSNGGSSVAAITTAVVILIVISRLGGISPVSGAAGITGEVARVAAVAAGLAAAVVAGGGQIVVSGRPGAPVLAAGRAADRPGVGGITRGRTVLLGRTAVGPGGRLVGVPGRRDRVGGLA